MKKTLIALAAVAATSAAFAQSSVTLYGVADAGIVKSSGTDVKFTSSGGMNNGTTRWGMRGVEDLGGGLKAGFNFEQGLSLADGGPASGGGFARSAYLNLTGGFGELRLGRSLHPQFFAGSSWELTGTANYGVVSSQFNIFGAFRTSNQIAYTTPNFGGVSASLGYVLKGNDASTAIGATGNQSKVDFNVIYRGGPLTVALGYDKLGNLPFGAPASLTDANKHVGAKYDFGSFQVAGSLIDPAGTSKGFTIGGSTQFGPVALTLDIARDTFFKDTNVLIEGKYALSKRTFAYAAFLNDGKGKTVTATKNLGLGIRHNF